MSEGNGSGAYLTKNGPAVTTVLVISASSERLPMTESREDPTE